MLGTANKKDMNHILSPVTEGQIYDINGFVVKVVAPTYQAISGPYYVEFNEGTELTPCSDCNTEIPVHRFALTPYQQ